MLRIRRAEEAVAQMVEAGEALCPCHLYIGQEAIATGVCASLRPLDTVWGGHRSHGHYLAKGGSLEAMFAEILGKSTGCSGGRGGSMHLVAPEQGILGTVPIVAGTVPLAAGAAMAYKMRRDPHVAVAFFGDGTLEEGHVHEAMNLAALYRLPVIFICENNLYSSHLHWTERRVADNLDRAGDFHSIPSARVDGNDVEAVFHASSTAIDRARSGQGPSFLECRTFRWRGHVGASTDIDVGVQRRGELTEWLAKDPVARVEARLRALGLHEFDDLEIQSEIETALARARAAPLPSAGRLLHHVFAEASCAS
ncbi:MAG TPA: thiamine pyrophosphate-dependent dehydrogenase E1 component subunit alpha [Bryobacteraceae bacterium]|jgi:TPP-dependent pyruvate/acetoin dehydrogenase alpha subunit|nr:thiamine pyrophosphate-dependent dehydrogenase E1 component subunit alpha [Bryobacteraceae bacterium]